MVQGFFVVPIRAGTLVTHSGYCGIVCRVRSFAKEFAMVTTKKGSGIAVNEVPMTDAEVIAIILEERKNNPAPPPPRKIADIKEMRFF